MQMKRAVCGPYLTKFRNAGKAGAYDPRDGRRLLPFRRLPPQIKCKHNPVSSELDKCKDTANIGPET